MFEGFLFTFNDAGSARAPSRRDYMADSVGRPAHWLAQAPSLSSLSVWFLFFFTESAKGRAAAAARASQHRSSLGATENRSLDPPPLMPTPIGPLALWVGRMGPGHAAWCLFGRRVVFSHPCPQHLWVAVCSHETLQLQAHAYPLEEVQVHAA